MPEERGSLLSVCSNVTLLPGSSGSYRMVFAFDLGHVSAFPMKASLLTAELLSQRSLERLSLPRKPLEAAECIGDMAMLGDTVTLWDMVTLEDTVTIENTDIGDMVTLGDIVTLLSLLSPSVRAKKDAHYHK